MTRRPLLLVAIVVLAGCGETRPVAGPAVAAKNPAPAPDAGSIASHPDAGAEAGATRDPGSRFAIDERGADPRRELARGLSAGTTQSLELSTVTRVMRQGSELAASVVDAPAHVRVRRVMQDGAARFEVTLGPFRYRTRGNPELVQMMTQGSPGTGTLGDTIFGRATITRHGLVGHVEFKHSKKSRRPVTLALAASLLSSAEELPSGKLGAGARWHVQSSADVHGTPIDLVARYALVAFAGHAVRLRVEHQQPVFAESQSGGEPTVTKKDSDGEWVYRLDRVFPEGSEVMKRDLPIPGTQGLELWSEVHLAAR